MQITLVLVCLGLSNYFFIDSNECREDDVSETVNVWHTECKESDVASAVYRWNGSVQHGGHKCSKSSTCVNTFGSYRCDCNEGWEGLLCDKGSVCQHAPCENNGTCFENGDHYTCNCLPVYTGQNCTEGIFSLTTEISLIL
ncbi:hypothetical protein D918_01372 [Trichuris suis]|nr:hypothetical protein D918_01372 [Trichuris suis]